MNHTITSKSYYLYGLDRIRSTDVNVICQHFEYLCLKGLAGM